MFVGQKNQVSKHHSSPLKVVENFAQKSLLSFRLLKFLVQLTKVMFKTNMPQDMGMNKYIY